MKVIITITQDVTAAKNQFSNQYKTLGTLTEAGPFKSEAEALNWKEFMMNRRDNYEEIQLHPSLASESYWFGLTLEGPTVN